MPTKGGPRGFREACSQGPRTRCMSLSKGQPVWQEPATTLSMKQPLFGVVRGPILSGAQRMGGRGPVTIEQLPRHAQAHRPTLPALLPC